MAKVIWDESRDSETWPGLHSEQQVLLRARQISGWYPESQLKELFFKVVPYQGKVGLEIGTWLGRSASVLGSLLAKLVCVDTWTGLPQAPDDTRYQDKDALAKAKRNLDGLPIEFCVGNSNEVLRSFPHRSFDVIHIDGDHSAPTVTNDVYMGWKLLRRGGLLCGDDFNEPDVYDAVCRLRLPLLCVVNSQFWYTYKT